MAGGQAGGGGGGGGQMGGGTKSSDYRGVSWRKDLQTWRAVAPSALKTLKRGHPLKDFDDEDEAAEHYDGGRARGGAGRGAGQGGDGRRPLPSLLRRLPDATPPDYHRPHTAHPSLDPAHAWTPRPPTSTPTLTPATSHAQLNKPTAADRAAGFQAVDEIPRKRFKGVCQDKAKVTKGSKKTWRASISLDGKQKRLGYYATEEEAAHAYDEEACKVMNGPRDGGAGRGRARGGAPARRAHEPHRLHGRTSHARRGRVRSPAALRATLLALIHTPPPPTSHPHPPSPTPSIPTPPSSTPSAPSSTSRTPTATRTSSSCPASSRPPPGPATRTWHASRTRTSARCDADPPSRAAAGAVALHTYFTTRFAANVRDCARLSFVHACCRPRAPRQTGGSVVSSVQRRLRLKYNTTWQPTHARPAPASPPSVPPAADGPLQPADHGHYQVEEARPQAPQDQEQARSQEGGEEGAQAGRARRHVERACVVCICTSRRISTGCAFQFQIVPSFLFWSQTVW